MSGKKSKWLGDLSKTTLPVPSLRTDGAIYSRWLSIFSRCYGKCNANRPYSKHHIKVADEWHGIEGYYRFKEWSLSNGFKPELCIDRINGLGDYSPDNCRWVTKAVNAYNRLDAFMVEIDGEQRRFVDLCRESGIPYKTARARISHGMDVKTAITMPVQQRHTRQKASGKLRIVLSGVKSVREKAGMTQAQLATALNVSQGAVANWENGLNNPTAEKLLRMSAIFSCSIDELLKKEAKA